MHESVRLWLEQAQTDISTAKYNLEGKKLQATALFVQQSVEKALKALFLKRHNEIPKVHDVVFLAKKLKLPPDLFQCCKQISPFYMQTRYPDAQGFRKSNEFSLEECSIAIKNAEAILTWTKKQL